MYVYTNAPNQTMLKKCAAEIPSSGLSSPRGVFVLVFEGLEQEDPKELERHVDWPAPLPWWLVPPISAPRGTSGRRARRKSCARTREGQQHDVLHWRVQLLQQLHPTQLQQHDRN
jgi:hypothetical protein